MKHKRIPPGDDSTRNRTERQAPTGDEKVGVGGEDPEVDQVHDVDKVAEAASDKMMDQDMGELVSGSLSLTRTKSSGKPCAYSPKHALEGRTTIEPCRRVGSIPENARRRGR